MHQAKIKFHAYINASSKNKISCTFLKSNKIKIHIQSKVACIHKCILQKEQIKRKITHCRASKHTPLNKKNQTSCKSTDDIIRERTQCRIFTSYNMGV